MKKNLLTYLTTQHLKADRKLFHDLPIETARRYHLLPVAREGDHITIAMANPEDHEARQVVSQAFGNLAYIVQADPESINYTLALVEPENPIHQHGVRLLVWQSSQQQVEVLSYARGISKLLHGEIFLPTPLQNENVLVALINQIKLASIDLLVIDLNAQKDIQAIRETKLIDASPISILFARAPRWPLKQILLILCDEPNDDFTLNWAIQLAYTSQASLNILPVLAPAAQMYSSSSKMQHSLSNLLTSNCPLSERMRAASRQMAALSIEGVLHLRHEIPQRQISAEIADGNYDLIILPAAQQNLYRRWMVADLVSPLLSWIDRPVLVAKSTLPKPVI